MCIRCVSVVCSLVIVERRKRERRRMESGGKEGWKEKDKGVGERGEGGQGMWGGKGTRVDRSKQIKRRSNCNI